MSLGRNPLALIRHPASSVTRLFHTLLVFILVVLLISGNRGYAATGDLDPTFGGAGTVTTDFGDSFDAANAVALQSDGKIVAAGTTIKGSPSVFTQDFAVARYNTNGSLDTGFGAGGKVTTDFSGDVDAANAVALQNDGKIVVAGFAVTGRTMQFPNQDFALARYNSNGSLDATFGTGGKVTTDFSGLFDTPLAMAIQNDGKIVLAGSDEDFSFHARFALSRYNSDGSLDITFGSGGKVTTEYPVVVQPRAAAFQADNAIVVAGSTTGLNDFVGDFLLTRYHSDGSVDTSFGTAGSTTTDFLGRNDQANAIAIQIDGKIIAGGRANISSDASANYDFGLSRYNTDGSLDASFGTGGKLTIGFAGIDDECTAIAIQPNGKIVIAGFTDALPHIVFGDRQFALARLNGDGGLDSGFGMVARIVTDFGGIDEIHALAIQSDGKIIAAGIGSGDFALARYVAAPPFDLCLQDDSGGDTLRINSTTGEYQFTKCGGFVFSGMGSLVKKGSIVILQHYGPDRRVLATIDYAANKGFASIQVFPQRTTFNITDRNTTNNTCACR